MTSTSRPWHREVVWRSPPPLSRADLIAELRRRMPATVHEAYLFGSYARGEASGESDVDLILVADTTRAFPERFRDFPGLADGLPPIDLLVYSPAEWATMRARPSSLLRVAMTEWVPVIRAPRSREAR